MSRVEAKKYYTLVRSELFTFIPDGKHIILEVGCGAGQTLLELKRLGKAAKTVGIEVDAQSARSAGRSIDEVLVGDVESMKLPLDQRSLT